MQIQIKEIKISPRIRQDAGNLEELASSMSRMGLLQPIVIDSDHNLLAGGRRLAAAITLGWTAIEATLIQDCDEIIRKEIELEENLRRKDLTWVEEIKAVKDLYDLKQDRYGATKGGRPSQITALMGTDDGYSTSDAAEELDRSKSSVVMDIQLANALEEFPYLEQEKTKSAAWKRFKRDKETKLRAEAARRNRLEEESKTDDERVDADEASDDTTTHGPEGTVRQAIRKSGWRGHGLLYFADARDVLRLLPSASIDCICTDPPFGLGMFKEGQATGGTRLAENAGGMYEDDPHKIMDMLDETFMHAARVLKPDGHAYVFFHMTRYEETFQMLRKHFGSCEETPLIWAKNTPGIGDPNISWTYSYEPCFWVNRGRHLIRPQAFNVLRYDTIPPNQKVHPTQKPAQLLRHIISASAVTGEVILDPFAGSGSTLVAANQVGCRFVGVERHEPFYRSACEYIDKEIQTPKEEVS